MSGRHESAWQQQDGRGPTMEKLLVPSVNVSPDAQSTPNIAQISPGPISWISYRTHQHTAATRSERRTSISFECMRTSRGTLTFLPVRAW